MGSRKRSNILVIGSSKLYPVLLDHFLQYYYISILTFNCDIVMQLTCFNLTVFNYKLPITDFCLITYFSD